MIANITTSRSFRKSLLYNEQKLHQGKAECIYAGNFIHPAEELSFDDKLHRFQQRAELNDRVTTCQHISLNFSPRDQLTDENMQRISRRYMKEIGFQDQPYVVYRHDDAGHPHCHIVTTHIKPEGDRIDLYNIGRDQSRKACKIIEKEFDLTPTGVSKRPWQKPESPSLMEHGKDSTAQVLSYGIDNVYERYIYTSLDEYNAALSQYHVEACPSKCGLLYRYIDNEGHYLGRPIPASFFDTKPTFENLQQKFTENEKIRQNEVHRINSECGDCSRKPTTFEELKKELACNRITIIPEKNKEGICTEIYYIQRWPYGRPSVWTGSQLEPDARPDSIQRIIDGSAEVERLRQEESLRQSQDYIPRLRLRI